MTAKPSHEVSSDKKQLLHSVCENAGNFHHREGTILLLAPELFAGNDKDIGQTSKLKHGIHR